MLSLREFIILSLAKSIKNEITFEKKLHDEVPSGKNYIIKNIKGKDFIVVKNLEGQNKETLVNSILSDPLEYSSLLHC
jgi:hypothetical protein